MKTLRTQFESGAVSLFVVIFSMLVISVATVSFVRIMANDQRQASNNDVSQSALDSAEAGVEDAKRALLRYRQICSTSPTDCGILAAQLVTDECNQALFIGGVVQTGDEAGGSGSRRGEVRIQQSYNATNDQTLQQAYTCVKIKLQTDDYIGTLLEDESRVVPLVGTEPFDSVVVRWYSRDDLTNGTGSVNLPALSGTTKPLVNEASWPQDRPPLLRAQLMQFGTNYTLDQFDYTTGSESNTNTMFLYPTSTVGAATSHSFLGVDSRRTSTSSAPAPATPAFAPRATRCAATIGSGGYSCSATLTLPSPIGGGTRTAFLRLTPYYTGAHFQVQLQSAGKIIQFEGVQPAVDSTGRANDFFRRIESRVNLYDTNFTFPDATVDITGNFCKDFSVTDTEYIPGTCTP